MFDPFEIFDLDKRFDLDEAQLHTRYLAACAQAHPDRTTDPVEQIQAVEQMSKINEAYRLLTDPQRRTEALLDLLENGDLKKQDALPPDLLMEMMEVRERTEAAISDHNRDELETLRLWANEQRQQYLQTIATLFNKTPPNLASIRQQLNALRYIERMLQQMPMN